MKCLTLVMIVFGMCYALCVYFMGLRGKGQGGES